MAKKKTKKKASPRKAKPVREPDAALTARVQQLEDKLEQQFTSLKTTLAASNIIWGE